MEEVLMKATAARVHRVWVVDKSDRPVGLVSLTDIIGALSEARERR